MGKKFTKITKIFFFLFIASLIAVFFTVYTYYEFWFLFALFIASYSGGLAVILAVRDKAKIDYSKGTKIFFIIFILTISTDIFSLVGDFWDFNYYFYYVSFAFPVSIYSTFISGIIVLILGLRDRSRPPMKGPVPGFEYQYPQDQYPQYQPKTPISNAELTKILQISSRITIQDAASAMKTDRANLLQYIAENQENLPKIQIEGDYIINTDKEEWVCQICGFANLGPKTFCSECKTPYSK